MDLKNYNFSFGKYKNKNVIWIDFQYSLKLKNDLKTRFPSAKWSASNKKWYLPDFTEIRKILELPEKEFSNKLISQIRPINQPAIQQFIEQLKLKAYSKHTLRLYVHEFASFLVLLKDVDVNTLTPERLKNYFLYCLKKFNLTESAMNSKINAIKFYFEQVQHQPKMFFDIPRPKKPLLLPKTLTKTEVVKILDVTHNPKHKLILKLCYGMGLRVSEIVNLKIEHIDSEIRANA